MRKAPPKTHTYTIALLLAIISVAGGLVAIQYTDSSRSGTGVAGEATHSQQRNGDIDVQSSSGSRGGGRQDSLNPQQAAEQLQSASGERVYNNYDSQSTAQPRQNE